MAIRRAGIVSVVVVLVAGVASAQSTMRVSVSSAGTDANASSRRPALSGDGHFVAFESTASDVVAGDANGAYDVFLRNLGAGTTVRASIATDGSEANGDSYVYRQGISADGRLVAFESVASDLVPGDANGVSDIFVHDTVTGQTERVSVSSGGVEGNGVSALASISADGRFVVFTSAANNLVANDTSVFNDVYVHDRTTGVTTRVSVDSSGVEGNAWSVIPSISGDGRYVAFYGDASNLVPNDSNQTFDAFIHDCSTGSTIRISVDSNGNEANSYSHSPAISTDGAFVAFCSVATNLVAGDSNGVQDSFLRDLVLGTTTIVSRGFDGSPADGASYPPGISDDGRYVSFTSSATNLVPGDTNGVDDTFVFDRVAGTTTCVSVHSDGTEANDNSIAYSSSISGDGQLVAFASLATNLVDDDADGFEDVFVHDSSCGVDASWSNYGSGFPGKNGVPSLTAQNDPVLGTTLYVDLGSSATAWTIAAILVGDHEASIPMRKGGDLLVVPLIVSIIALPSWGTTLDEDIDDDPLLCGLEFFAQTLIVDPGAAKGQSASAGLKLVLGY